MSSETIVTIESGEKFKAFIPFKTVFISFFMGRRINPNEVLWESDKNGNIYSFDKEKKSLILIKYGRGFDEI